MGQQRRGRDNNREPRSEYDERIIDINRVAKVIKGGRRFAFRVTVVVGDNKGQVALATGKARAVPDGIRKAIDRARRTVRARTSQVPKPAKRFMCSLQPEAIRNRRSR